MRVLVVALVLWALSGITAAWLFRRQGHNFGVYAILGIGFGPLIGIFLLSASRNQRAVVTTLRDGKPGDGWLDVLVGLDGTDTALSSTREVIELLGPAIRRLRLVSALDIETGNAPELFDEDDELARHLDFVAEMMGRPESEIALVTGRADHALVEHALAEDMDLLVVAHRRPGLRSMLFGSTVARLARNANLPLVIGPPPDSLSPNPHVHRRETSHV